MTLNDKLTYLRYRCATALLIKKVNFSLHRNPFWGKRFSIYQTSLTFFPTTKERHCSLIINIKCHDYKTGISYEESFNNTNITTLLYPWVTDCLMRSLQPNIDFF